MCYITLTVKIQIIMFFCTKSMSCHVILCIKLLITTVYTNLEYPCGSVIYYWVLGQFSHAIVYRLYKLIVTFSH